MKNRMVIIDGNSLINRAFYALPPLTTKEGLHTNALYGFVTMLLKILEEYDPQYIGVAFDKKAPTFRHRAFDAYKAGRKGMPPELAEQIEPLKEVLDALGIYRIELEGFEADDLIGTLAKYGEQQGVESLIVTGDKDALQLISDEIKVLITKKGISSLDIYDEKKLMEDFQVTPSQFIDLKGLMGDKSDNIPGVPGVGEKTAIKLLHQFGSVENLIQNIQSIDGAKLREKIEKNRDQALLSKRLATIITQVPVEINLEELKRRQVTQETLLDLFKKYEFTSLMGKLRGIEVESTPKGGEGDRQIQTITSLEALDPVIEKIKKKGKVVLKTLTEEKNIVTDQIIFLGMAPSKDEQYIMDLRGFTHRDEVIDKLKDVIEDPSIGKIGHDLKKEIVHFYAEGMDMQGLAFDTMIGEYLIDPAKSSYGLKELGAQYLGVAIEEEEKLRGKGRNIRAIENIPKEEVEKYLGEQLYATALLVDPIGEKMKEMDLEKLYYQVELPLTEVLASMEYRGIKVDRNMLELLEIEFSEIIDQLTKEIYGLAGMEFNINSPKQLGEVLFEKLSLPPIMKTKTGYSTKAEVLERLLDRHEIIPKILEYRQVTKLKTTYVDGLLGIINPVTHRIHSNFNQTVTTTGRISSTEPNLQNIPVKLEMGRRLRKVFIAEEGHQFVDADYSQIELRVLAHISGDENLQDAFLRDQDIHSRTASEIFNVPIEEVTSFMRSGAKAVNFGIVYGISDFGLSQNLNITRNEAKKYIDNYLDKYAFVRKYMHDIVETARKKGYVLTLFNRRRYLPELKSSNFNIRSFGERMAMNTPIQGSAADIIKIAMVSVYRRLKEEKLEARLILQVHDELIVEVPLKEREIVAKIVKESMEGAMTLAVPLKVDLSFADNWYDAK